MNIIYNINKVKILFKKKISSSPINIFKNPNPKPIIQKTFLKKLDFETLDYIETLYNQEKYDKIILETSNIKIEKNLHPLDQKLMLEILKYQICASFQLNNCNAAQNFILKADPFLSGNLNTIISFYDSILQMLNTQDHTIVKVFEPTKSYIDSIVSRMEILKGMVDTKLISGNKDIDSLEISMLLGDNLGSFNMSLGGIAIEV